MGLTLGFVESQFAELLWQNAPLTTRELVVLCSEKLNWKRTTTYTVLKKLCDRGIFETKDSMVTVRITKSDFCAMQSEAFVEETFHGSLPAFIAAFSSRKQLSQEELKELRCIIASIEEASQ